MEAHEETPAEKGVRAFRETLVDDVYAAQDFIPWDQIDEEVRDAGPGIRALNALAQEPGGIGPAPLADALLEEPKTFTVVQRLLAAPAAGVGFVDGRQLPESPPKDPSTAADVARLMVDVGIDRLVTSKAATEELLRVALIAGDTRRRSGRRRRGLEERLDTLLGEVAEEVEEAVGHPVSTSGPVEMPPTVRNRLSRVLYNEDGRPFAAVATMFEAIGGGRQNQTFRGFLRVQDELDLIPVSLVLIADGRGVRELPTRLVEEVWDRIGGLLSLRQSEDGMLADALSELSRNPLAPQLDRLPLDTIIRSRLDRGDEVSAEDLPVGDEVGRVALARFEQANPDLDLTVDPIGGRISYARAEEVAGADHLEDSFDPDEAIALVGSLISRSGPDLGTTLPSGQAIAHLSVRPSPLVPGALAVAAQTSEATVEDVRAVAAAARRFAPETTVALLLVPDAASWIDEPDREVTTRTTATSVVVLGPDELRVLAAAKDVERELSAMILRQADLTKASPFVHNGVTPPRLFHGRRIEETNIVSALATSSVAVLGSRQMGKTSLLHRVRETLDTEGRGVYYGDCQAIGDWDGFKALAERNWGVELSSTFAPDQVAELVSQLDPGGDFPILILDEIDPLVAWDRENEVGGVREAFFRGMRALSQEGRAQFVFTGERTIADVFWSPDSPHWNFCQSLPLRQLAREDAAALLFDVLGSLSISFVDRALAEQVLWRSTSGHPRLVQLLGDKLVQRLNERPGDERDVLAAADLEAIVETFDFKTEYVETYWGQATDFEKDLTRQIAEGRTSLDYLQAEISGHGAHHSLRVLELYGIIDVERDAVSLRAEFLPEALTVAGPRAGA
jgi:hypothetical protein